MASRTSLLLLSAFGAHLASFGLRVTMVDPLARDRLEQTVQEDALHSPGPQVLSAASFGHRLALADLMWLAMVQELGKSNPPESAAWDRVRRWADVTTDLDPRYFTVYHSTAIQLALYGRRVDASDRLLQKGWVALPSAWELPFVLGYNAYFIHGAAALAADYMVSASRLDGAPTYLPALAGRMRYHSGDYAGAILLLEELIPNLDGPARVDAEQRLALLRSEPILVKYDQACEAFERRHGTVPTDVEALRVEAGIAEPPTDLLGTPIFFDQHCIARTKAVTVRESEAQARVGSQAAEQPRLDGAPAQP